MLYEVITVRNPIRNQKNARAFRVAARWKKKTPVSAASMATRPAISSFRSLQIP